MILMIDNFDSFTWNIVQYIKELDRDITVLRNDSVSIEEIEKLNPSHIVISPGPGRPKSAGISMEVLKHFYKQKPILGVCLGHQCMGEFFGGDIISAKKIMHGKISRIKHNNKGIFNGIPSMFNATRYHSLAISRDSFPAELIVTAETEDGEIMGLEHESFALYGVQFHPESILSEYGHQLLQNFLNIKIKN